MLEKVKQYAMEKYAGNEVLANEFVDGFVKQAAQNGSIPDSFRDGVGSAFGKGLGGLAVGLGIHGLNQAFSAATHGSLHTKFLEALARAISMNRLLQEGDKEEIQQYAETIFKFAPHVACDSNLLSTILASAIQGHKGAGIDPMTIKTLGDLESRFIENRGAIGFSPKSYV